MFSTAFPVSLLCPLLTRDGRPIEFTSPYSSKKLMKTLNSVLLLFVVLFVAGCGGSKEAPVVVIQDAPAPIVAAPKELSLAEKQILFEAKQKANKFYELLERERGRRETLFAPGDAASVGRLKITTDFSSWTVDEMHSVRAIVRETGRIVLPALDELVVTYDYLLEIAPDAVRERSETTRNKMKHDLKEMRDSVRVKYNEIEACFPAMEAELEKRRTQR